MSAASHRLPVVGLSANVLDPRFNGGCLDGIGMYTRALEAALRTLGVTTRLVGAPVRRGVALVRPAEVDTAFGMPLPWSIAATALTGASTQFAGRVTRAVDVYHATDYLVPRLTRTPVVATLYDAIPLAHPRWTNQRLRALKNWILRAGAADADLVLAISASAAMEVAEHYRIPHDRIRVVPLGVEPLWFERPPAAAFDAIAARGVRKGCFLFVGTLQPRKNVEGLVAAYDRLPTVVRRQHQLVIAGRYGWAAEALRADLEARRGSGEVLWLDYVPQDELRAAFALSRAFVFPTLAEGFGLPMLEAFASRTPVIASDISVLREFGAGLARFVPPGGVEQLAHAMEQITESTPEEKRLDAAVEHARAMTWEATARKTIGAYNELLGGVRVGST